MINTEMITKSFRGYWQSSLMHKRNTCVYIIHIYDKKALFQTFLSKYFYKPIFIIVSSYVLYIYDTPPYLLHADDAYLSRMINEMPGMILGDIFRI